MGVVALRHVAAIAGILAAYVSVLGLVYSHFPELSPEESSHFILPKNLDDAKNLGLVLSRYKNEHFYTVLAGVASTYLMLQSFAIPGSIFLTILSGYLFPFTIALPLVCACSACGAAVCYFVSLLVGRKLVMRYFPGRVAKWQLDIQKQQDHLLNYIIFLRITPVLPNWFINIASPVLDVPLRDFFFGTFIGVAPPSLLFIQAGTTLQQMTSTGVMWSWTSFIVLTVSALISIGPVLWSRLKSKAKEQ
ncbi:hypothetical protein L596_002149 [Steinernema carpocapsae]|uniref:VTT domain-containing protein n=1 Tax=Steinernema carpocapsae TaxID=34508 RepID=A0A4U8UNU8_STECR|nr:hypothetical protein L596_002149 [Steinernema carpocapsae]